MRCAVAVVVELLCHVIATWLADGMSPQHWYLTYVVRVVLAPHSTDVTCGHQAERFWYQRMVAVCQ